MPILGESIHPVPQAWEDGKYIKQKYSKNYINIERINVGPVPSLGMILRLIDSEDRLNQVIIKTIQAALDMHDGHQTNTAKYLGVSVSVVNAFVHGRKVFNYCRTNDSRGKKKASNRAETYFK